MNKDLEQIAYLMAAAGHDYVQISKSTGLTYQEAEAIWQELRKAGKDGAEKSHRSLKE